MGKSARLETGSHPPILATSHIYGDYKKFYFVKKLYKTILSYPASGISQLSGFVYKTLLEWMVRQ